MWHLFGPLVRWPLHSPLRLLGVVVGVVMAVLLLGEINDRGGSSDAVARESASAEAGATGADPRETS